MMPTEPRKGHGALAARETLTMFTSVSRKDQQLYKKIILGKILIYVQVQVSLVVVGK